MRTRLHQAAQPVSLGHTLQQHIGRRALHGPPLGFLLCLGGRDVNADYTRRVPPRLGHSEGEAGASGEDHRREVCGCRGHETGDDVLTVWDEWLDVGICGRVAEDGAMVVEVRSLRNRGVQGSTSEEPEGRVDEHHRLVGFVETTVRCSFCMTR